MSGAVIDAELAGSTICSACGITVRGSAPVLALCRALIGAGFDPNRPLHVYRGQTMVLKVRSIGAAAKLTVTDIHGRPRLRRMPPQDWMQEAHPLPFDAGPHSGPSGDRRAISKAAADESEAFKK